MNFEKSECSFNWYAVYTKHRWEKKVARLFTQKQIESYCPLNKVQRQWADRKKIVLEPLFTSYVFVRVSQQEQLLVRQTEGVINFVYWLKQPAIIREQEITTIKKFLNDYVGVQLQKIEVKRNDIVKIMNGPLISREAKVLEINNKTVKVELPCLGYSLIAQVDKRNIEQVKSDLRQQVADGL